VLTSHPADFVVDTDHDEKARVRTVITSRLETASGHLMANAAWLALAVMAHNLGRAVGQLAGADLERATAATLRRCDGRSSPCRAGSCTADDADTYDYRNPGPGRTPSAPPCRIHAIPMR
jgi:hypothetical protein